MKHIYIILTLTTSFLISGCAGIFNGHSKEIEIASEPTDAYIYIDGWIAKTPTRIALSPSNKNYTIKIKKDGYVEQEVEVKRSVRYGPVFFANLGWLFAYPYAVYVDFSSGNAFEMMDTKIILEKK